MPRDIDERKKRKALRKLRKAAELAEAGLGPPLSDWEREFLEEVEKRVETYGSAFADPEKGDREEPLSVLQQVKLKEIDRKARGKSKTPMGGGGLRRKPRKPAPSPGKGTSTRAPTDEDEPPPVSHSPPRPALRVIRGGRGE